MTEDYHVTLWDGTQVSAAWLADNAPHLAQHMQQNGAYSEACSVEPKSLVWQHTKITFVVFCVFAALLLVPGDGTKEVGKVGILAVIAFTMFIVWLIMLPQALWLGKLNRHTVEIADGTFTYTKRMVRKETSHSVPLSDVRWRQSSTKRDAWFRTVPHKKRKCIIAEIPVRLAGVRISRVRVACGLSSENRVLLNEFIAIASKDSRNEALKATS